MYLFFFIMKLNKHFCFSDRIHYEIDKELTSENCAVLNLTV